MKKTRIPKVIIVLLIAACIVGMIGMALASDEFPTPPPTPGDPDATPQPTAAPSSGGNGGGGYVYIPIVTPSPTPKPTPSPPNRLDVPLPTSANVGAVPVDISGTQVSVPGGYDISSVISGGQFEVPVAVGGNASGKLVIAVDPASSHTGTIKSIDLLANKTLVVGGQQIGVSLDISLSNLPAGSGFNFDLKPTDSVNMAEVNRQLASYSDKRFSSAPLLVFEATKNGLQNGRDITGAKFTFTVPRPAGFDPNATYYVIRQSDGMMEVLNATLVGSPAADPLTFEVVSPHGLSTFTVVKAESAKPTIAPTAAPSASPTPAPASGGLPGGMMGYLVVFGAFVVGIMSGVAVLVIFLWLRVR